MSKAKEYAEFIQYGNLQFPRDFLEKGHQPYCEVSSRGELSIRASFPALLSAVDALQLANWIYETFGEVKK